MPDAAASQNAPGQAGTVAGAIRKLACGFRQANLSTPELDARLLVLAACGIAQENYVLCPEQPISPDAGHRIAAWYARRLRREPVSRIVGVREFWGRDFALSPSTLDPRPETETLIEAVLQLVGEEGCREGPLKLLDLGTGTGCILLTLLAELPRSWGLGVDIDAGALATAAQNADKHGLRSRSAFCCSDWTTALAGEFDCIVANPPYLGTQDIDGLAPEVSVYDPRRALDGGADGYHAYRRICRDVSAAAAPGAWLALEAGAGQAPYISDLLVQSGWGPPGSSPRIYADLLGHDRVVVVRKHK